MGKKAAYTDKKGWDRLEHQLQYLVPPNKKKWIWRDMARKALAVNRARIRAQENLDGSKFAARSDGSKKKMLAKTLKGNPFGGKGRSQTRVKLSEHGVVLLHPWKTAAEHHFGATRTQRALTHEELLKKGAELNEYNRSYENGARVGNAPKFGADAMSRGYGGESQQDSPCTKEQAKILKKTVGFKKITFDGKTKVTATIANLRKNFTMAEAGYIIRKHRISHGNRPKSTWTVSLPSRHVLGLSETDERLLMHHMSKLIAKYSYFSFSMQPGEYDNWASSFTEENMINAA